MEPSPTEIFVRQVEKKLEAMTAIPKRPPNIYVLSEDGETAGVDMDINQAAFEALNAAHVAASPDSFAPSEDLFDLAGEPDYAIEEFQFVRDVLMEMPDVVLAALCKQRGWKVER
ncbi:hypothetical protein [Rhodoplanes sp. Z2-YC6860]|uniref:hypothetical protein n=1 Tax=Rhodoplanes sp. Z2-YC6860 TaxID=674703 RepID=UPI00082A0CB7|nr:hypothetical protein [Rhodoplanes sp. Z2-YC6860]